MKTLKKLVYVCVLLHLCNIAHALDSSEDITSNNLHQIIQYFSNSTFQKAKVSQSQLPTPYNDVLTQPLMTNSIKTYYQRTPIIKIIYSKQNPLQKTYSRLIKMIIDKNKYRNNPSIAQKKKEAITVELAYITINFDALPKKMIAEVLHTTVPFGQLLTVNHIKVQTKERTYFSTRCNEMIKRFLHCKTNTKLYGRTNTIYSLDNQRWIAHVIEVLPNERFQ
jgi:hypothetical protein